MKDYIEETNTGIYRITPEGKVYSQSKLKTAIVGKGMQFTGKFKVTLKPERELTYTLNNRGYLTVGIMKKTHMVHRLVAKCFVPNPDKKPFINHKNGNKLDNNYSNLEWCTIAENNKHARDTGLWTAEKLRVPRKYRSEEIKKICLSNLKDKSKLTENEVRYVRKVHIPRHKEFSSTALAAKFGTSVAAMNKIVKGQSYTRVK